MGPADHPEQQEALRSDAQQLGWFVQEVRRYCPFLPVVGGLLRLPQDPRVQSPRMPARPSSGLVLSDVRAL